MKLLKKQGIFVEGHYTKSISTMKIVRLLSAILLALPLLVFGSNYFFHFFSLAPGDGSAGETLLQMMRDGGLMSGIALSHIVIGILLLLPRTRTFGALIQFPLTLGIVYFHATMLPAGAAMAVVMLVLNILAMSDRRKLLNVFTSES